MATTALASAPLQSLPKSFPVLYPASSSSSSSSSLRLPFRGSSLPLRRRRRRRLSSSAPPPSDRDWPFEQRIRESLAILDLMEAQCIAPGPDLLGALIKSCADARSLRFGRLVHDKAVCAGLHTHPLVANSLILLYGQCGHLGTARRLFDEMPDRDVVSWTTIISVYHRAGFPRDALDLYRSMTAVDGGVRPNMCTYTVALSCCASVKDLELGLRIHEDVLKDEIEGDEIIMVALIDMYSKCGRANDARAVLDQMPSPTIEACTAMIEGYNGQSKGKDAIDIIRSAFKRGLDGEAAQKLGYASVIRSFNIEKALRQGQEIHARIIKLDHQPGFKALSLLVELYENCDKMIAAKHIFYSLIVKDYSFYARMISGFLRNEMYLDAFKLFVEMTCLDLDFNHTLVSLVIKACVGMVGLEEVKQIHCRLIKSGNLLDESTIGDIVEFYYKFESLDKLINQGSVANTANSFSLGG